MRQLMMFLNSPKEKSSDRLKTELTHVLLWFFVILIWKLTATGSQAKAIIKLDPSISAISCLMAIFYLLTFFYYAIFLYHAKSQKHSVFSDSFLQDYLRAARQKVKYWWTGGNIISMHLNLGKDDISEMDVLKKIVQNVSLRYKVETSFFSNVVRFFWFITLYIILILSLLPYYQVNNYERISSLKSGEKFHYYLPSQIRFNGFEDQRAMLISSFDSLRSIKDTTRFSAFKCEIKSDIDSIAHIFSKSPKVFNELMMEVEEEIRANYDTSFLKTIGISQQLKPYAKMEAKGVFIQGVRYVDYFITNVYRKFSTTIYRDVLPSNDFLGSPDEYMKVNHYISPEIQHLSDDFLIIPKQIDYLGLLYLLFVVLIIYLIGRYKLLGFNTHSDVRRKLRILKERIDAETIREQKNGIGVNQFSIGNSFRKRYPIADFDIIEVELIALFRDMARIPTFLGKPRFIFVFDELDKIEPFEHVHSKEKEAAEEGVSDNVDN